jgi:hypothetical protein
MPPEAEFDRPTRETIDINERDRSVEDLLRGTDLPQLPALRADAFAPFIPVAAQLRRRRDDAASMQARAKRVGALCGSDGFYRFPAGGSTIEGPTVRLAKALANEWGSVAFGVEIDRVEGNRVYLTGVCIDLVNIVVVRRSSTFVLSPAPGKFANKADQVARWEAMQVQSAGAKALRGAILDALPTWFVDPAYQAALDADRKNILREGQTIEGARDEAVKAFAGLKIKREQLEAFLGSPIVQWAPTDIATLRDVMRAIRQGETTAAEVFEGYEIIDARSEPAAPKSALPGKGPTKPKDPPKDPPKTETSKEEPAPKEEPKTEPAAKTLDLTNPPADDSAPPM